MGFNTTIKAIQLAETLFSWTTLVLFLVGSWLQSSSLILPF